MKIGAIITAAGLSTRMGGFKPLMQINGFPMIWLTAVGFKNAGISDTVVVLGTNAAEVSACLSELNLRFTLNESADTSDMFESVKLGIRALSDCDAFFVLPCDMPLISPKTLRSLIDCFEAQSCDCVFPRLDGKTAHPPLISADCADFLLDFHENGGLKAALSGLRVRYCDTDDCATRMDADTPQELEMLRQRALKTHGISREMCENIYEELGIPLHIRKHCREVADSCEQLTDFLNPLGFALNAELCVSAAMLHDCFKAQSNHCKRIQSFLALRNYTALSEITGAHKRFPEKASLHDEATIVSLADRLVYGSAELRYRKMLDRFPKGEPIGEEIRNDLSICNRLLDELNKLK